jgi:hypothetical protein
MPFLLAVAGYRMRNHQRNEDITRELGLTERPINLHIMSDVRHACVYCYHGNTAKLSSFRSYGIMITRLYSIKLPVIQIIVPLEAKMESYRHVTGSQFVIFKSKGSCLRVILIFV